MRFVYLTKLQNLGWRFKTILCFLLGSLASTGCNPVSATTDPAPSPSIQPTRPPTNIPTATPSPRPSTAANETVCAAASTLGGTDVSNYQAGSDWAKVASTGQSFAFVKATEGMTYTNPDFSTDWPAVANNGIVRGAYHFFYPEDDPVAQADYFLTAVGTLSSTDLPPMLDWETTDGVSTTNNVVNAVTWLERVAAATGKTPIIYVSSDFLNGLGNPAELIKYPLFVAQYGITCPSIPPPWSSWAFWQSSENGSISGITGSVDLDTFNGSAADLKLFASTGVY